jgi:hypothetical protein
MAAAKGRTAAAAKPLARATTARVKERRAGGSTGGTRGKARDIKVKGLDIREHAGGATEWATRHGNARRWSSREEKETEAKRRRTAMSAAEYG